MITRLKKSKKGFTLVELIVVIAIIAILAAVTVPLTMTYVNKAKVSSSKDQIETIKSNLTHSIAEYIENGNAITRQDVYDILKEYGAADKIAKVVISKSDADGNAVITITAKYDDKGKEVVDDTAIKATASIKSANVPAEIVVTYDAGIPKVTEA